MWNRGKDVPATFVFAACAAMWSRHQGPGALPEIGGTRHGWRQDEWDVEIRFHSSGWQARVSPAARKTEFTEFITTGCAAAGSCAADTIDVHRASCALSIQLSRRRFPARGIGYGMRGIWNVGHGSARSRRSLWRAAFLSGREENFYSRSYRSGSYIRGRVALPAAGCIAHGISESLPAHHEDEIAGSQR